MYVCMCVYVSCVYTWVYVCMHGVYMHVCICVCMYVCMYTNCSVFPTALIHSGPLRVLVFLNFTISQRDTIKLR